MEEERFKVRSASYIFVLENNKVLLQKREGTNFMCGWYGTPAGHLEKGEGATNCAIRELKEETGLTVNREDLELKFVLNRVSGADEYIDFFFVAKNYLGIPKITEPEKCSDLGFFDMDNLPENTIPYIKKVLEDIKKGIFFGEIGYNEPLNNM